MQVNSSQQSATRRSASSSSTATTGNTSVSGFQELMRPNPAAVPITKESDPEAWNTWVGFEDRRMQAEIHTAQSQVRKYNNMVDEVSGYQTMIDHLQADASEMTPKDLRQWVESAEKSISRAENWMAKHSLDSLEVRLDELTAEYSEQKAKWAVE